MAVWKIELLGPLRVSRAGEEIRFRTRQQALLLALLAVQENASLGRSEIACRLWPDAQRENAMAYLRRAVMELRKLGIEIASPDGRLLLEPGSFESDLSSLDDETACLVAIDHSAAVDVRAAIRRRLDGRRAGATFGGERPADAMATFLFDALIADDPEAAIRLLHHRATDLRTTFPPEPALDLCLRIRERCDLRSPEMVSVANLAAISAHALTRYGLAERLYKEAIEEARGLGHVPYEVRSMTSYALMLQATRRLGEAEETATRAVRLAEEAGATVQSGTARGNLASIQKERLDFESAEANYRIALDRAVSEVQVLVCQANLAAVHAFYGVGEGIAPEEIAPRRFAEGYAAIAESYLHFAQGFGRRSRQEALLNARRFVGVASGAGMERHLCIALDCAAMALALGQRREEAAACARLGSAVRLDIELRRSPSEALALRRHVPGPYFGPSVSSILRRLKAGDPAGIGSRVLALLEA